MLQSMPLMVNSASQPLQYEHDGTGPAKTTTARPVALQRKLASNDGIHRAVPGFPVYFALLQETVMPEEYEHGVDSP